MVSVISFSQTIVGKLLRYFGRFFTRHYSVLFFQVTISLLVDVPRAFSNAPYDTSAIVIRLLLNCPTS